MKFIKLFFCVTAFAVFSGCAGVPKMSEQKNTLIMGRFHWIGDGSWTPSLKGTFSSAFGLSFRRVEDDKIYKTSTKSGGWFFLPVDKEGIYELVDFSHNQEIGNTRYIFDSKLEVCFVVEAGKVCNLGDIEYHSEEDGNWLNNSREYAAVRNDFKTKFEKSNWNEAEWSNVKLRLLPHKIDDYHYVVLDRGYDNDDPRRFYWLWIQWNYTTRQNVKAYPVPLAGDTAEQWVKKNIALVPGTEIRKLSVEMEPGAPAKEYIAIVRNTVKITQTYILFDYSDDEKSDTIMIAY